ncbi:MAG TPA: hypothetical protein VHC22_12905 [Pirellulales bacterium]|nr:hypothetical protein [Pirellulales bacterium]
MAKGAPAAQLRGLPVPSGQLTQELIDAVDPRQHPEWERYSQIRPDDVRGAVVLAMQMKERTLALKAFDAVLGRPERYVQSSREELITSLADDYRLFGLSTGRSHTEELVRVIERLAERQAREHLGKERG